MKVEKSNKGWNYSVTGILILSVFFIFTSCAQRVTFLSSTVVPAADGRVKVKQDDNRNYQIDVKVTDLADVGRLKSSKETYVVWMETDRGNIENLGQLRSSRGFLSRQHTATLETVSAYKPTRVFVTTEHGTNARHPSNEVVLTTERF
jgi:hypothetical protein